MTGTGPSIEHLTRRLADTHPDLLAEPRIDGRGEVEAAAVVSDLFVSWGARPLGSMPAALFRPAEQPVGRNWLRCVLIATGLLADPWFAVDPPIDRAWSFLTTGPVDLTQLAAVVPSASLVADEDRREELARLLLKALDLRPDGETEAQAGDRLATLDSVERVRVITATREAEERAAAVRKAMHEKAAAEAAAKASRE